MSRYDPKTDRWSTVANLSVGRDGISVGTLGDRLFAIGGCSGQHYLPIVEVYNDQSNEWTKVKPKIYFSTLFKFKREKLV